MKKRSVSKKYLITILVIVDLFVITMAVKLGTWSLNQSSDLSFLFGMVLIASAFFAQIVLVKRLFKNFK